jgi:hypothetical protein
VGIEGCFGLGVKLTTYLNLVPMSRMVKLYLHCLMRLHGVVLNQLNTGTVLLFFLPNSEDFNRKVCLQSIRK